MRTANASARARLAVVATHPIQYYAPWFAYLASALDVELRVFYLWDFGVAARKDPRFEVAIAWDVPLLEGYAHEFVPNRSPRPSTEGFLGYWNPGLLRRLTAFAPGAVLLTTYNNASIARLLLGWRGRPEPLLFRGDSHRLEPRAGLLAEAKRRVVAAVFRRFAAALYVGGANRDYFRLHGMRDDKLFYAPHAVDNARFTGARAAAEAAAGAWRASLGVPSDHRLILYAGKFEAQKRPLDLLRAFQLARPARTALLFVGAGSLEGELRGRAAGGAPVFFAPFQNQSLMPRVYAAADVVVLPSERETWGMVVNEAMCMGLPAIVSSHVGCARELVVPQETGLVFQAGSVEALRDALIEAFGGEGPRHRWGESARRRVAGYSYRETTAGLQAALQSVGVRATWRADAPA